MVEYPATINLQGLLAPLGLKGLNMQVMVKLQLAEGEGHVRRTLNSLDERNCWPNCYLAVRKLRNKYSKHTLPLSCNLPPIPSELTGSQMARELFMQLCLLEHRAEFMSKSRLGLEVQMNISKHIRSRYVKLPIFDHLQPTTTTMYILL